MLGQVALFRKQRKPSSALEVANRIIASYPNFIPALVERMYILLEMLSWDALLEAAQRLGGISHDNVDSMLMISWYELCCEGPSDTAATFLQTTRKAIEKLEPGNAELLYLSSRPFTRLANQNTKVLEECEYMIQTAIRLNPAEAKYHKELGYIYFLLGDLPKSKDCYEQCSRIDPHNIDALEGVIRWLVYTEQYSAAEQQLEMFIELQRSVGSSATISQLNSVLALKYHNSPDKWLLNLRDALQSQLLSVHGKTITYPYKLTLDLNITSNSIQNLS